MARRLQVFGLLSAALILSLIVLASCKMTDLSLQVREVDVLHEEGLSVKTNNSGTLFNALH